MYQQSLLLSSLLLGYTSAFPWVPNVAGVDSSLLGAKATVKRGYTQSCPNNPVHPGAVPINDQYPYLGAIDGKQGTGKGGIQVPTPGDTAHYFEAPGPLDIRGPCPGLNTAANHHFLSHDGLTTYNELVDMQQNVYNVGYDLANLLAIAGVGLDGDLVNSKLSIGCDSTAKTSSNGGALGDEGGLDTHNKFEGDTSLTRNDYFLGNGDNFRMNGTLFGMMVDTCKNNFSRDNLALYRYQRYQQSVRDNGQFFFGPGSLLLYGAASFLYELFPSYGNKGVADLATMESFFGASQNSDGTYSFNNQERIPDNWFNRVDSYNNGNVGDEIFSMYGEYPVAFGGNIGQNNFNGMNFSNYIVNGQFNNMTGTSAMCLLYQAVTAGFPVTLSNVYLIPAEGLSIALKILAPGYANLGCPTPLFPTDLPV